MIEDLASRFSALDIELPAPTWHGELPVGVPVADIAVPADEALRWWRRLHLVADQTGYQPVLVDPERSVLRAEPQLEELTWVPLGPAERLAECAALDPATILSPRGATLDTADPDEVERWLDEWPEDPQRFDQIRVPAGCDLAGCGPTDPAVVALVPAAHAWQVPALLSFGNFNDCPRPSVHGAMLRHWQQRYGVDLVAMEHDALQFVVSRPPRTRREALEFAWEYACYCPDGFDGLYEAEDLGGMAACLIDAEVVRTWWD